MSENSQMGRPPEYNSSICQKLIDYFNVEIATEKDGKRVIQEPRTMEGFLFDNRIPKSTFYKWKEENQDLMDAFDMVRQKQIHATLAGSMLGLYNPAISKMLLVNISDLKDKVDHNHESKDGSMSPVFNFTEKK